MRTHTHMQDRCVSMIYFLQLLGSADGLFCLLCGGSCTWSVRLTTSVCLLQIDLLKFLLSKELDFTIVPFKSTWEILAHMLYVSTWWIDECLEIRSTAKKRDILTFFSGKIWKTTANTSMEELWSLSLTWPAKCEGFSALLQTEHIWELHWLMSLLHALKLYIVS